MHWQYSQKTTIQSFLIIYTRKLCRINFLAFHSPLEILLPISISSLLLIFDATLTNNEATKGEEFIINSERGRSF